MTVRDAVSAWFLRVRRVYIVAFHLGLVVLSNFLAYMLRFEGSVPPADRALALRMLPALVLLRGLVFIPFRLYEGLWRYVGLWDLRNIIGGVLSSSLLFYLLTRGVLGLVSYPRSVFILDAILLVCFIGGIRLTRRIARELGPPRGEKRVLVYGAGDAGEMIVRDMLSNPAQDYRPVAFLDDDKAKRGRRIHGVPVLGSGENLDAVLKRKAPHEILVALPSAPPARVRDILKSLESSRLPIKTLPHLREILDGRVAVGQIRNLSVEDLLDRAPVDQDPAPITGLIRGRRVLVTGAGGSIGSELCRQIAAASPEKLLLLERSENALYEADYDLRARRGFDRASPLLADLGDAVRLESLFKEHRPQIVFHAAAHKHVPMTELNPCEAVKNNILGTRTLARTASQLGVERFILISTDKAVNPSSVMGATKRVAEILVRREARDSDCALAVVRFGNVLGSSGSVVPRFQEQIRSGGPVTVTHPEMKRFFMLIPEAVHLVLHAAARGEPGATYVLEMGEQIKIVDMARTLIRLSGLVPDKDIAISFTGVRPGEKLDEQLLEEGEKAEPSGSAQIVKVLGGDMGGKAFDADMKALESAAAKDDAAGVLEALRRLIPTFKPAS